MKLGICLPNAHGSLAQPEILVDASRRADEGGLHSVWMNDHLVTPRHALADRGDRQAQYAERQEQAVLEPLVTLAYVAATTHRITLGTSVLVAPLRNPLALAKQVTTLDVLSGGRVLFGVGVGWVATEFAAAGRPWKQRGADTDHALDLALSLWNNPHGAGSGSADTTDYAFMPPPTQAPHPPIWIGGRTGPGSRRAARFGDAWHPSHLTLSELRAARRELDGRCEEYGRDPASVALTTRRRLSRETTTVDAIDRRTLHGPGDALIEDLAAIADTGVEHLVIELEATAANEFYELVDWIVSDIVPNSPSRADA